MIQLNDTVITRDAKGKIRVTEISCKFEESIHAYAIERQSGLLGGKMVIAPVITVDRGKAKRSLDEQALLQYNSELKKYLDKGYKNINNLGIENLTLESAEEALPETNTDQNGVLKPMLAKKYQDASPKLLENEWYASRKINGVRCFLFWDGNEIKTVSRGATNYDVPTTHLRTHPKLIEFFKQYPDIILDGELFKFGLTLNTISGLCRKQEWENSMNQLEFYMYDIADLKKPFVARYNTILKIQEILGLGFAPEKEWTDSDLKIQIVPHELISGAENIKNLHDKYVSEGWEGLVIRDKVTPYKPGARGNFMLKYKAYQDKEYLTVGLQEGLRREDFTFIMETESGNRFNAKPIGSREIKEQYRANLNNIIGKMATVKYFEMSGAGTDIPQQPIWLGIRECE